MNRLLLTSVRATLTKVTKRHEKDGANGWEMERKGATDRKDWHERKIEGRTER